MSVPVFGVRLNSTIAAPVLLPVVPLHSTHNSVPLSIQVLVALLAGGLASLALLVATSHQSHGDVVPLLAIALGTREDLLDVPNWQVSAGTVGLGISLGVAARLVGIAVGGTTPAPVMGVDLLTAQDLVGTVVVVIVLYLLGAFVLVPRFTEDITRPGRVHRQWLVACLVFATGFLTSVPLATLLVPGA